MKHLATCFIERLVAYANHELVDICDHLAHHLTAVWRNKDNRSPRLVVETKLPFLVELVSLGRQDISTNKEQIRALIRTLKELDILEDNRTKAQGAAIWRFTLKLWSRDTKNNLQVFLQEWDRRKSDRSITSPCQDWGASPGVPVFFGRTQELELLKRWIIRDRCQLIAILGMAGIGKTKLAIKLGKGGIGKTDLSLKLAHTIQEKFDYVIWRSLLNAPPVAEILSDLMKFLSNQKEATLPEGVDKQVSRLLHYLRQHRCLLILDNADTLLQGGKQAGHYRAGYEGYGKLFDRVGEVDHQSCLLLTSREKLQSIERLAGEAKPVRFLELGGLNYSEGREVFKVIGKFSGSEDNWRELIEFYNGNPLALEVAAHHIQEVFGGNVAEFLKEGKPVFKDLRELLDWHFERLSDPEKEILYWLAINREPTSLANLKEDILSPIAKEQTSSTLQSLQRRLPLERNARGFALQPVLIEYISEQLIEKVSEEIETEKIALFNSHALSKALAKDYVRDSQNRLILQPAIARLLSKFGSKRSVECQLAKILATLRNNSLQIPGYAGGNLLNLLCYLDVDLSGYDFSKLAIWQAHLMGKNLHQVNFAYADLAKSVFTQTSGSIMSVTFSPDGKELATGDANGEIRLLRVADSQHLKTLKGHTYWVWALAFSDDGQTLASGSEDGTVRLWEARTGECFRTLQSDADRVWSIALSHDGQTLVSGNEDSTVRLWDARTGQCLQTLCGHTGRVKAVALDIQHQVVASGSEDNTIKLWNIHNGECQQTLYGHADWLWSVAFSPDGQILASSSNDSTIKLWDIETGQCFETFNGHTGWVPSVAFSPDGCRLASSGHDGLVRLWDLKSKRCFQILQGHTNRVWSVAFSPDGRTLASAGDDQTIRLWEANSGQCLNVWQGYAYWILSVTSSANGQLLASSSNQGTVALWDAQTAQHLQTFSQGQDAAWVGSVTFSPDSQILASGGDDGAVRLWHSSDLKCLAVFQGHTHIIWSLAFSPNGQILASGCFDGTVRLWDIRTGQCLHTLKDNTGRIWSVAFSPDGKTLASASDDPHIRLWDTCTGQCLQRLGGHTTWVFSVNFSSDGRMLASSSHDGILKLWDLSTRQCLHTLKSHKGRINAANFSLDNQILLTAGEDQTLKLWDVITGKCLTTLHEHTDCIWSAEFSPDGQSIVSGSADGAIKLWDVQTGHCFNTLRSPGPYEDMNITGVTGLTEAQKLSLKALGAVQNRNGRKQV